MMHHHTKFDQSEILSGQTFTEVQNLHCDLDLEYSKATFHKTLQLMNMHCQTKLVAPPKSAVQNIEIVIFDCMNRNSVTVTLTLKIETHFSHMMLWLIMMSHHTGFVYKWFSNAYHPN